MSNSEFFEDVSTNSFTQMGQLNSTALSPTILDNESGGSGGFVTALRDMLTSFQANGTPTYTKNWTGLVRSMQAQGGGNTDPNATASFQTFSAQFQGITGAASGNWSSLQPIIDQFPTPSDFFDNVTQKILDKAIGSLTVADVPAFTSAQFMTYISKWLTATGNLQTPQVTDLPASAYVAGTVPDLNTYQNVYQAFFGTTTGFSNALQNFYNTTISREKYFIPSQHFANWVEMISNTTGHVQSNPGTDSDSTRIIFELLSLVKDMVGTLEDLSSAQVERLKFYSNWQQSYTDLIAKVPVVTVSKLGAKIKGNDEQKSNAMQQVGQYNDAWTQKLRSFRDNVASEAKSHQTAVDQTKDAINAQSSLATTLLQDLRTILQSLFP